MGCIRFRFFFVVLLIYLVSLGDSVASAKNRGYPKISSNKSLGSTRKMHGKDSRSSFVLKARPETTIRKNTKGSSADTLKPKATKPVVYHGSLDPFKKTETKREPDEVTEMFNMLHKDYQSRAGRRPPINNNIPLKDLHVKP